MFILIMESALQLTDGCVRAHRCLTDFDENMNLIVETVTLLSTHINKRKERSFIARK